MIGKVIYSLLSGEDEPIYPVRAIQGQDFPFRVYHVISDTPTDTKDGVSELDVARVQIDHYATSYLGAVEMSDTTRSTIDRYRGTTEGIVVDKIVFEGENDMFDNDAEVYKRSQDYFIRIKL